MPRIAIDGAFAARLLYTVKYLRKEYGGALCIAPSELPRVTDGRQGKKHPGLHERPTPLEGVSMWSRSMRELRHALAEISAIKAQVALGTQFRGYGPRSIAASGVLALLVASIQARFARFSEHDAAFFLTVWVATAAVSVALSAWETIARAKRVHVGISKEMVHTAVEQFLPAVVVGILLTVVLTRSAPQVIWMLPGLWAIAFSLGIFASCRFLPRPMFAVGLWYLVSGLVCLVIESGPQALSPWSMGVPFGIGQLLVAATLEYGYENSIEER